MITNYTGKFIDNLQTGLYDKLNKFSASHQISGRICSIPVSLLDVSLDIFKSPLRSIENVALVAINLIGAIFKENCTIKHAVLNAESALTGIVILPVKIVIAPLKIIYQFFAIIIDPVKVNSIANLQYTFKS